MFIVVVAYKALQPTHAGNGWAFYVCNPQQLFTTARTVAMQDKRFLSPSEVATTLRVSTATVYRRLKAGELRHVRIGSQYRIPAAEVKAAHQPTTS